MEAAMGMYTSRHPAARIKIPAHLFMSVIRLYCRLKVEGSEHIPEHGPFLLVANHTSHADTPLLYASLPSKLWPNVVAAAASDYFFTGGTMEKVSRVLFNTIPIARKPKVGVDPLRHVVRALREGYGVVLYPEGTRSRDGSMAQFRSGVGRLLADFPYLPVLPAYIEGTGRVMPKNRVLPRPYPVTVRFGPVIDHLVADPGNKHTWRAVSRELHDVVAALGEGQASIK
ncbi:1-acyl-sn-glycerol-3-phosphate acyltransferase [Chloroflexia bacterium SDU3-3]|nr:1-acyl-sn-glycerol-3-phosphate acyltransferase [Chloroflexia bacterium SDU3-3]